MSHWHRRRLLNFNACARRAGAWSGMRGDMCGADHLAVSTLASFWVPRRNGHSAAAPPHGGAPPEPGPHTAVLVRLCMFPTARHPGVKALAYVPKIHAAAAVHHQVRAGWPNGSSHIGRNRPVLRRHHSCLRSRCGMASAFLPTTDLHHKLMSTTGQMGRLANWRVAAAALVATTATGPLASSELCPGCPPCADLPIGPTFAFEAKNDAARSLGAPLCHSPNGRNDGAQREHG